VFGAGKLTGGTAITNAQMPIHAHDVTDPGHFHTYTKTWIVAGGESPVTGGAGSGPDNTSTKTTGISIQNAGGGAAHDHSLSLDLAFHDVIIATKD